MVRVKRGELDVPTLSDDDLALLAKHGDEEALTVLWEQAIAQVERITGLFARRYPWVEHEDLVQTVLVGFPKIVFRYDPWRAREKKISWNKYLYFAFYRATQDALRREDPLGVGIPQKAHYPNWRRFSEMTEEPCFLETIILDGIEKLDRGEPLQLSAVCDPGDENSKAVKTPEYHDQVYHGRLPRGNYG